MLKKLPTSLIHPAFRLHSVLCLPVLILHWLLCCKSRVVNLPMSWLFQFLSPILLSVYLPFYVPCYISLGYVLLAFFVRIHTKTAACLLLFYFIYYSRVSRHDLSEYLIPANSLIFPFKLLLQFDCIFHVSFIKIFCCRQFHFLVSCFISSVSPVSYTHLTWLKFM